MKYKNVEAAREARLWITHVIFPVAVVSFMILSNPNVREKIRDAVSGVTNRFSTKGD